MGERPRKPEESDCCGSGCLNCVFTVYEKQLKDWESGKRETMRLETISPLKYAPFIVNSITELCSDLKLYEFQLIKLKTTSKSIYHEFLDLNDFDLLSESLYFDPGDFLILKAQFDNEPISRPYTPIVDEKNKDGLFRIYVKIYEHGKMSQFWSIVNIGFVLYWRGPFKKLELNFSGTDDIFLFGAGTGVVPLYNIVKSIVENENYDCKCTLFNSFQSSDYMILRSEICTLLSYWNFKCLTFFSNQTVNVPLKFNECFYYHRINKEFLIQELKKVEHKKNVFFVCGTNDYNKFIKDILIENGVNETNIQVLD